MITADTLRQLSEIRDDVIQATADGALDLARYREVVAALNTAKSQLAEVVAA